MNACSNPDAGHRSSAIGDAVRRCRPLLGTFVEITAHGGREDRRGPGGALHDAVNTAFAAVERIQNLLSTHDPDSELSLVNRRAANRVVTVSAETFEILRHADQLATESGGAFDYTVAPTLAEWGLLPAHLNRINPGTWRDVRLLCGRKVRFLRPLALDLGGIAKGFAVDAAIEVLHAHGVVSAIVNAGGDLRVFGPQVSVIHLRHPAHPQTFAYTLSLQRAALATSSPCFTERGWHGQRVSHLVNPLQARAVTGKVSVSVCARECWLADALTKVVLNAPRRAEKILARFEAEAFVLAG